MFRKLILDALEDRYNSHISEAEATIKIYLENPVAIGEHPQHVDEVDKLIALSSFIAGGSGARGTPSMFVNDFFYPGYLSKSRIEELLKQ